MALKDIWQQDRQTRQLELQARQQTVADLRSQHQTEHQAMATQLRQDLSTVLPKLRADEHDRHLEAQCAQAGRVIEAEARRQEVQTFLQQLEQEKRDRQAAVQAMRDYVWGPSTGGIKVAQPQVAQPQVAQPQPVGAETIDAILELAEQAEIAEQAEPEVAPTESFQAPASNSKFNPNAPDSKSGLTVRSPVNRTQDLKFSDQSPSGEFGPLARTSSPRWVR